MYLRRCSASICLGLSFLVAALPSRSQQFDTKGQLRLPTVGEPSGVLVADLNGDGRPDVLYGVASGVSTNSDRYTGSIYTLLAQADGTYKAGSVLTLPADTNTICVTGDANGDGKADLICSAYPLAHAVAFFPGNGDGSFGSVKYSTVPMNVGVLIPTSLQDLNGDGRPDLFVNGTGNYYVAGSNTYYNGNNQTLTMMGDGTGSFTFKAAQYNSYSAALATLADVNGDGKLDLLPGDVPSASLGNGDGTFAAGAGGSTQEGCAFADVTGDGKPDAVCVGNDLPQIVIYAGNGDGSFSGTPIYASDRFGSGINTLNGYAVMYQVVAVQDLNGDGIPDVLGYGGDGWAVAMGKPGLSFSTPQHYAAGYLPAYKPITNTQPVYQLADMNRDGLIDLVVTGPDAILLNYGQRDGSFGTPAVYRLAGDTSTISYIAVADFDGDGIPDVASSNSPSIMIAFGKGDGTFRPAVAATSGTPAFGTTFYTGMPMIAAGDFDGDGKQDLFAASSSQSGGFGGANKFFLRGHGDGTFEPPAAVAGASPLDNGTGQQHLVDVNADGKLDVVSGDGSYGVVSLLSIGNGTFRKITTATTAIPAQQAISVGSVYYGNTQASPAVGDFDGDGKLDAVQITRDKAYFQHGHADGSFDQPTLAAAVPLLDGKPSVGSLTTATGDFDGDGKLDLAVLFQTVAGYPTQTELFNQPDLGELVIFYGNGDGTFVASAAVGFTHPYRDIASSDLDRDGRSDLLLSHQGIGPYSASPNIADDYAGYPTTLLHGRSNRTLAPAEMYFAGGGLASVVMADLNHDGRPDLIASNANGGLPSTTFTVLMNGTGIGGTLLASPEPSAPQQSFTVTAKLTPSDSSALSGNTNFLIDGAVIGAVALSGDQASLTVLGNYSIGSHSLTATWPGDATHSAVTLTGSHVVTGPATTMGVVSSENPATAGDSVTFTATITASSGVPTGSVSFTDGGASLATAALLPGSGNTASASFPTSSLSIGQHAIAVAYAASASFGGSGASLTETIAGKPVTITLNIAPGSGAAGYAGQATILSATVTDAVTHAPLIAGTVTFTDGSATLGSAPVNAAGYASIVYAFLNAGIHHVTATYAATGNYAGRSAAGDYMVRLLPTTITLTSLANASPALAPVSFVVKLSSQYPSQLTFNQPFLITEGQTNLAAGTLGTNGSGTITLPALSAGAHTLTAIFVGSGGLAASISAPLLQKMTLQPTSTLLTSTINPASQGQAFSLKAQVAGTVAAIPTGTVTFLEGSTTLGSAPLVNGVATLPLTLQVVGTHVLTAVYSGDVNFAASASATLSQRILASDFSFTASSTTISARVDDDVSFTVTATGTGTFADKLNFAVTGQGNGITATASPSAITLVPGGSASAAIKVHTTLSSLTADRSAFHARALLAAFAGLPFGLLFAVRCRRRVAWLMTLLVLVLCGTFTGCSVQPVSIAPVAYHLHITATGAQTALTHSVDVTVNVVPERN